MCPMRIVPRANSPYPAPTTNPRSRSRSSRSAQSPTYRRQLTVGDCADLLERLRLRGFVVGAGYGELARGTIRIGHMGDHTVAETEALLGAMDDAMVEATRVTT